MFILHFRNKHYVYHGAIITEWSSKASASMGLFVFLADNPYFIRKYKGQIPAEVLSKRLLVHEYGHTIQSLILGPLYLIVIGLPSMLWGYTGVKKRRREQVPYGAFFTEGWANSLGERATGEEAFGMMVLD